MKKIFALVALALAAITTTTAVAQTAASAIESKKQTLFNSANHSSTPYRIPAIATLSNGDVIAIADQRPCGADVGNGEVDIYAKISSNNGSTWTPSSTDPSADGTGLKIADGTSSNGYGDAAVVANRESGEVMAICVAGKVVFSNGSSSKHNKMARLYSSDYGKTWKTEDVTTAFFDNLLPNAYTMFMASGKILQSTKVKKGNYYRLYGALLVRQKKNWLSKENVNYVVYSDDFGKTWAILGGGSCISSADEAKVEELPNGNIVVSSRKSGGRYFNVFSFSNLESATGSWGSTSTCSFGGSNATNGELLMYHNVTNVSTGEKTNIILQSLPTGSSRSNVAVFYKVIDNNTSYSSSSFTSGWTKGIEVDNGASGYSTMTILPNGEIGFLYEDNYDTSKANGDYSDIVYVPLTVSEITGGAYTYTSSEVVKETVATPAITPNGGELKYGNNTVSIACDTDGATIYYTTNGATPTTSSTKYTGAFTLTSNATVKAIAVKTGWNNSSVASASFTYTVETVATPVIAPNGGEIEAGTTISISCATSGATIYYSTNGAEPTTVYSAPFALNEAATVKAVAKKTGWNNSATAQASFTIKQEVVEPEEPEIEEPEEPEFVGKTWTVNLKSGEVDDNNGYIATFSASVAVTLPEDVTAYVVTRTLLSYIYTSEVSGKTIPANTGVILFSENGGNITITEAAADATVAKISTNKLIATGDNSVKTSSNKYFVLQEKSGSMTFVKVSKNTTVAANTAYLEGSSWYSSMKLSVDNENPEVSGVEGVEAENAEVEYYNLQGVKVENPEKGIFIKKQGNKTTKVIL
jgi:sialidase-1